jgi:hypothetical protein
MFSSISGICYSSVFAYLQVTAVSRDGINKICLSQVDSRTFCFGVRIVRRRTVAQVFLHLNC